MQVKTIFQLKNQNKLIRETIKTSGVAKLTIWEILKKKVFTSKISNSKSPGRPKKTTKIDHYRLLFLEKKNHTAKSQTLLKR